MDHLRPCQGEYLKSWSFCPKLVRTTQSRLCCIICTRVCTEIVYRMMHISTLPTEELQ